jgi:SPP1 gp7 family putative phage head morphogenesis protein
MALEMRSLPPEEAIAYLKAKGFNLAPTFDWRDMWQADHAAAFTVAKSAGFDVLGDIHSALVDAMANGTTFADFAKNLTPILQEKGWWGRGPALDPDTGQLEDAQLGSPRRLQTIFDVNMRMAYEAGKWSKGQATKATHPYAEYSAIMDDKTRPEHRAWNGTIVHLDDPWLETHTPPCGWNCRCTLRFLSDHDLKAEGLAPTSPPPSPTETFINARTGEVTEVPEGVDPGFGYNPGKVAVDLHAARVAASKWVSAPPELAAAASAESVKFMLPSLTQDFGEWVGKVTDTNRPIGDRRVIGAVRQEVLDFLDTKNASPLSGAITIEDRSLMHIRSDRHVLGTAKRAPVAPSIADLMRLPDLVANPEKILWDKAKGNLLYIFEPEGDARAGKVAMEVNLASKGSTTKFTNGIVHSSLVQPADLNPGMYETVWEK